MVSFDRLRKKWEKIHEEQIKQKFKLWGIEQKAEKGGYRPPDVSPGASTFRPEKERKIVLQKPGGGWGGWIFLFFIIGIALFVWGVFINNEFVGSLVEAAGATSQVQQFKNEVTQRWEFAQCFNERLWTYNVGTFFTTKSLDSIMSFCNDKLGMNADEVGCRECFDFSIEALNSRLLANRGQDAIVKMTFFAEETEFCYNNLLGEQACQPITPAANPEIKLTTKENFEQVTQQGRCSGTSCSELDPNLMPFTVVGRISDPSQQFCGVNTVNAIGKLTYTYRTEGSAPINVRRQGTEEFSFGGRNPITLPGPVKVDIIPDSFSGDGTYEQGLDEGALIFIKFRNSGQGVAQVTGLTLSQITPEGASPLAVDCGDVGKETPTEDGVIIEIEKGIVRLDPQARSSTVFCEFDISGVQPEGDSTTYIVIGEAVYDYELERRASSILVDQSVCGQAPASGAGSGGGVEQVETIGGEEPREGITQVEVLK